MKATDSLAKQGIFILAASTVANASNFFFQFIIGRMLGPAEYSVLTALLSLFMILSVPTQTIQTVVAKYAATFKAKKNNAKISYLLFRSLKKLSLVGILSFVLFTFASGLIASFLKIPSVAPVIALGSIVAIALVTPMGRGVLQGLQEFNYLGVSYIIDALLRLAIGILLVWLGFKATGALAASFFATFIALGFVFIPLKFLFGQKGKPVNFDSSEIYNYFWPVLITLLCFTTLTNVDIILVKHFFSPEQAGLYSAASLMGKIVLFFPAAFSMVMFSKTSELHAQNADSKHILKKSLLFVGSMCAAITISYFAFPSFLISIVYGPQFIPGAHLLGLFGIAMCFFSLLNILLLYYLSVHQLRFIPVLVGATILQVTILWFVPLKPVQVIYVLIANALLLLILVPAIQSFSEQKRLKEAVEGV
ncbi:hypothetical protein LCGC14_1750850 [marine sediment metagenome]|uniref:Polysaccharide biosynthesis protein C-terminal domain-containing protein n=1 Tax=marine sediment metagenome TaxID=412755 RepID=A0A0F9H401_9ZZZZ